MTIRVSVLCKINAHQHLINIISDLFVIQFITISLVAPIINRHKNPFSSLFQPFQNSIKGKCKIDNSHKRVQVDIKHSKRMDLHCFVQIQHEKISRLHDASITFSPSRTV